MVGRCITVGYDTAVPTLLISNLAIFSSVVSCHNGVFSKIGLDNDVTVHRLVLNFCGSLISQILQIFNHLQKWGTKTLDKRHSFYALTARASMNIIPGLSC